MDRQKHAAEIRAVDIGKRYGMSQVLKQINLVIGRGEFVTLLGPSGSGKTTFLMILAGFEQATSGRLYRDGVNITDHPPETRNFGMVFQGYALFPHMTVADNIAFALTVRRRSASDIKKRVNDMVECVGLQNHIGKKPAQLSGGQQQRVALARALSFEPDVLLLDEPFSALDKNLREAMQGEMARLHKELGTTFVFVTHDQSEALALSTHIAIFDRGKLLQFGTPREVYDHPVDLFTAEFLGGIELLYLSHARREKDWILGTFEGAVIVVPALFQGVQARSLERVVVGIRPEYVRLRTQDSAIAPNENAIPVRLVARTYLGAHVRLSLACLSGVRLTAELLTTDPLAACEPGTALLFTFSHADGRVIPHAVDPN